MLFCKAFCGGEGLPGNPAAVSIVEDFPDNMQEIAADINISETVFVKHIGQNRFLIRWFSPKDEAPLCGHATMAAAFGIHQQYGFSSLSLIHRQGHIKAEIRNGDIHIFMRKKPIVKLDLNEKQKKFCESLSLVSAYQDDLLDIYCLKEEREVIDYVPDFGEIVEISKRAIVLTAPCKRFDFCSRYFAPKVGIKEDPFCGSAHCRLVPLWGRILNKTVLTSYQPSGGCGRFVEHEDFIEMIGKVELYEEVKNRFIA